MTPPTTDALFSSLHSGQDLGASGWLVVDQHTIDQFGAATHDDDPMHVDPDWAREHGPFGHTVAYGFLTLSLLTHLLYEVLNTNAQIAGTGAGHYLNYGFDRVRFVSPVPVNSRVRGHFRVMQLRHDDVGRTIVRFLAQVEIAGVERPALVAEWLTVWVPPAAARHDESE